MTTNKSVEEIVSKVYKEWRYEHPNCGGGGVCQRDRIIDILRQALTEQLEEIERWAESKRTFQHPKDGDEGWDKFKGDWDTFNESVGYHKALDDTLSHLHSKKEEYKKV